MSFIADIQVYPALLPMKASFAISGGVVGDPNQGAPHVYVKIVDSDGAYGWGEGRPSHRWSYETLESTVSTILTYLRPALIGLPTYDLRAAIERMNRQIAGGWGIGQPIAKAAVDMALYDLLGKRLGRSLEGLWLASPSENQPRLSYLITTRNQDEAAAKAALAVELGYTGLDVKIGLEPALDIAILEAVKAAAPDLFLRVDANQAYQLRDAVRLARQMEQIGVDVFEQPLPANQLLGHAELRRKTNVPIALDESIWSPSDLLQAIRLEALDMAVIKITKMGGLHGARLCGEIAREAGLGLLGGGLTESRLGLAASARLFRYLDIRPPVDLNGPMFLSDDPLSIGPDIDESRVSLNDGPGHACDIDEVKLADFKPSKT